MDILIILGKTSAYSFFLFWIMVPAVWLVVGRRFNKIFKNKYDPADAAYDVPSLGRAGRYSLFIIFGKGMRGSFNRIVYSNYDFRKNARLIDKIVSYLMWIPFMLSMFTGMLYGICWLAIKLSAVI